MYFTGLPTKDEAVKTTGKFLNATIPRLDYVFCLSIVIFWSLFIDTAKKINKFTAKGIVNVRIQTV